jgi:hypothetical protein
VLDLLDSLARHHLRQGTKGFDLEKVVVREGFEGAAEVGIGPGDLK